MLSVAAFSPKHIRMMLGGRHPGTHAKDWLWRHALLASAPTFTSSHTSWKQGEFRARGQPPLRARSRPRRLRSFASFLGRHTPSQSAPTCHPRSPTALQRGFTKTDIRASRSIIASWMSGLADKADFSLACIDYVGGLRHRFHQSLISGRNHRSVGIWNRGFAPYR